MDKGDDGRSNSTLKGKYQLRSCQPGKGSSERELCSPDARVEANTAGGSTDDRGRSSSLLMDVSNGRDAASDGGLVASGSIPISGSRPVSGISDASSEVAMLASVLRDLVKMQGENEAKREATRQMERIADKEEAARIREEERVRMLGAWESDRTWKEDMEKRRADCEKVTQAVKTFPKISSACMLPVHLEHFSELMDSLHVDDKKKVCYLPEVLTGPMAVALHNAKVREGMTFAEVRAKLLSAAGLTVSHVRKLFFRPDVETLVKMSGVDVVHHVRSLIIRILTGGNYCDEVLKSLLVGFFTNVGTDKLVMSLNDAATDTVDDVIDIIHRSYENYGCVISTDLKGMESLWKIQGRNSETTVVISQPVKIVGSMDIAVLIVGLAQDVPTKG